MATLSDGFKDIFLAGIGAMAITGEKTKDLVDQLISKGELTVDQGKQINTELKHKAEDVAASVRYDVLVGHAHTFLFHEEPRWFVEEIVPEEASSAREEDGRACGTDAWGVWGA